MNPRSIVCMIIAAMSSWGGCASITVTSEYDPAADFSNLRTYQWMHSKEAEDILASYPIVRKRIEDGVNKALEAKGYSLDTSGTPDFYVAAFAGLKDKMNVADSGYTHGGEGRQLGGYDMEVEVRSPQEATLIIDISRKLGNDIKRIWRGTAKGTIDNVPMEKRQRRADSATKKIIEKFPPVK